MRFTLGQVGNKRLNFDALPGASKAPVDKVDACDASNPQCIIPYLQDIHRHYREAEVRRPALAKLLSHREPRPNPHPAAHTPLTRFAHRPRGSSTPRRRT